MTYEVKGVIARGKGAEVEVTTVVVPDPGPGEALVRVEACGVCHTDLHYREGGIGEDFPCLLGRGVMAGLGAALNTAGVTRGDSVAVIGCGGVGDAAVLGANLAGARKIIAVDVDPGKLEWARGFGATDVVNSRETDPVEAI